MVTSHYTAASQAPFRKNEGTFGREGVCWDHCHFRHFNISHRKHVTSRIANISNGFLSTVFSLLPHLNSSKEPSSRTKAAVCRFLDHSFFLDTLCKNGWHLFCSCTRGSQETMHAHTGQNSKDKGQLMHTLYYYDTLSVSSCYCGSYQMSQNWNFKEAVMGKLQSSWTIILRKKLGIRKQNGSTGGKVALL